VSQAAFIAVILASLLIMLYIAWAFRQVPHPFRWGVAAVTALFHDVLVVISFLAIMNMIAGWEVDALTLTAVLTVIGYSVNDTVVVFDRIRERFLSLRKATSEQVIDAAINETLSRTIMTSATTMITVLALLFLGGEILRGFATALTIGIVVGTYSSIYIASALALDLKLTARDLMPVQREKDAVDDMP
jgi:preprotein translocase subunit SecF